MAPDDNTAYASECARLAELTDNQALRDDLVDLALIRMTEAERDVYSNGIQPTARLDQPAPMEPIVWPRHRVKSRA
jgi:hypothetical protein